MTGPLSAGEALPGLGEPLLSARQVAEYLGVSVATVYRLAAAPDGLPVVELGDRARRFRPEDVRRYVESRLRQPAAPIGKAARLLRARS